MTTFQLIILAGGGLIAGILAGFLGIGGGTVLVPLLLALGYTSHELHLIVKQMVFKNYIQINVDSILEKKVLTLEPDTLELSSRASYVV